MSTQSGRPDAYRRLSLLFGCYPEIAFAKRYRVAQFFNINILQAEIAIVEEDLTDALAAQELYGQGQGVALDARVRELQTHDDGPKAPWNLVLRHRQLVTEYCEALLRFRAIDKLPLVNPKTLEAVRTWYMHPQGGNHFRRGVEDNVWDNVSDLTALGRSEDAADGILLHVREYLISCIHWLFNKHTGTQSLPLHEATIHPEALEAQLVWYPESRITRVVDTTSTIFASTLPALSIFVLIHVQSLSVRIGIISLLTLVFSTIMVLLGKARRAEIWAVSAAFSAVLVVFVGGSNCSTGGGNSM